VPNAVIALGSNCVGRHFNETAQTIRNGVKTDLTRSQQRRPHRQVPVSHHGGEPTSQRDVRTQRIASWSLAFQLGVAQIAAGAM